MEEISDHAKNLTLSEDLEKPLEERVDLFYNFVKVSSVRLPVVPRLPVEFPSASVGQSWSPAELKSPGPGPGVTSGQ